MRARYLTALLTPAVLLLTSGVARADDLPPIDPLVAGGNHSHENHSGHDHSGENLTNINLNNAGLSSTNLFEAILTNAGLTNANLARANLNYVSAGGTHGRSEVPEQTDQGVQSLQKERAQERVYPETWRPPGLSER